MAKVRVRLADSNQIATVYTVGDIDEFKKGSVISFNGRDGAVVSASGDYTAAQITGAFDYANDDADRITEGETNKFMTQAEKNKLATFGQGTLLESTSGTISAIMDGTFKNLTPTGDCTINASEGILGQVCTFIIISSGTTERTITFGTNFKSQGTLSAGIVNAKVFSVSFIYNGIWIETGRTAAM